MLSKSDASSTDLRKETVSYLCDHPSGSCKNQLALSRSRLDDAYQHAYKLMMRVAKDTS